MQISFRTMQGATVALKTMTQSRFRRRKSAPKIGAEFWRRFFVPDAIWYAKKSAPKINMDDAKIDESISSMPVMVISSHDIVHKTFLSITGRRSGHVHTRNRHETEHATDRRQNLVPEKSGTRSVWHTVQKSAPIFGADFRHQNLDCVSSALVPWHPISDL